MLPHKTYQNFNIELGKKIECKVDKVNCTGKVYLEPKHPYYVEGEVYSFEVVEWEKTKIVGGSEQLLVVVNDCFNNRIKVLCDKLEEYATNIKTIDLKVIGLKKGLPELEPVNYEGKNEILKELVGKTLVFFVKEVTINASNEDVFLLECEAGYRAELKTRHFKSYGLFPGKTIKCNIYSFTGLGLLKVEPENPYYKIGKSYEFDIQGLSEEESSYDDSYLVILKDCMGNKCGVQVNKEEIDLVNNKTRINCRVIGFRKGRPKLELDQ